MTIPPEPPPVCEEARSVFANRTVNLRSISTVGFDMDYTLVHYHVAEWERRAFEHVAERLGARGWPADKLKFDPTFATRGLVLDLELGNIVKATRFGYIVRAFHGTTALDFTQQRETYARTLVDLGDSRWRFLNTLFALSEAGLFAQAVRLYDEGALADAEGPPIQGYADLFERVKDALNSTHLEGELKAEIAQDPERFVDVDPALPVVLEDFRAAGKKLLLITNSEWSYTQQMMSYCFDRFLPGGKTWRDLFDIVVVAARKPAFFRQGQPVFEIVDENGLLRPWIGKLERGRAYLGGDATLVESSLGVAGEDVLYVGDHVFADIRVSKDLQRWRTALVVRELEEEVDAIRRFAPSQAKLDGLMAAKRDVESQMSQARLALQRSELGYGPEPGVPADALRDRLAALKAQITTLDEQLSPLAIAAGQLMNKNWGPTMRAGADKSHFARQIERNADVYTSRVANFAHVTPFGYLRSPRQSLPHDAVHPPTAD